MGHVHHSPLTTYLKFSTNIRSSTAESTRQVRGRSVRIETTFGDFKKTHGVLFPRLITVAAAGRPNRLRVVVDSIELNPPLDDARFELPAPPKP